MLLEFGNTTVDEKWFVDEPAPTGFCRVYDIKTGDVTYQSGEQTIRLLPGYVYVMPSVAPYSLWRDKSVAFSCTYLHIDPAPYFVGEIFRLDTAKDPLAFHYFEAIRAAIAVAQKKPEMLHELAGLLMTLCVDQPGLQRAGEQTEKILRYIALHLDEKLSVRKLSEMSGYHPNYFIELFRRETGVSPHQYLMRQRLQKAILLLREGHTVTETAEAVGFGDANSLARAFKAKFGVTPGMFNHYRIKP